MPKLTATEASRNFAAVLRRASEGETFEVTRGGTTIASIGPPGFEAITIARLREILRAAPPVDVGFADDVMEARRSQGLAPGPPEWPS